MNRGVLVILIMFGVAAACAVVAVVFLRSQGSRSLNFWGRESAVLIRHAPQVELLWLQPAASNASKSAVPVSNLQPLVEQLTIDGRRVGVVRIQDITGTRGLVHARHALITDASFDWDKRRGDGVARWSYALRFSDGGEQAVVAIDLDCRRVRLVAHDREASIAPSAEAFREFVDRYREESR